MMQQTIQVLKRQVQCRSLYTLAKGVSGFHRIQASGGFLDAAEYCAKALNLRGVQAKVLHYPARAGGFAGSYRLFQQWVCRAAWCRLTAPEELDLVDYGVEPISVIQKSAPCDYRAAPLDLVEMDRGCEQANYEDQDLTGKVLFVHQHINKFRWAIQKRGVLGLISDYLNETPHVRCPEDLPDTLNYTSYWWTHAAGEKKAFGFVVTPRISARLHALCQKTKEEYAAGRAERPWPQLNAFVDAQFQNGASQVVEAVLPGKSGESVLACAHLCHPCASANDNASGVAGAIEALCSLKEAIDRGLLPPLQRTIRLILVPEFTGTYNYLNDGRNRAEYLAGINLDMIGAKQEDTTGPITVTGLPWACPSFVGDLATLLLQEVKAEISSEEDQVLANVLTRDVPFDLGSDHFILSDPAVGIPSVMLGQWPDKYYHTSSDTLERLDMKVLKFSTLVAAAYLYTLCNFTERDAQLVWNHQRTKFLAAAERRVRETLFAQIPSQQLENELAALKEFYKQSAASVCRYAAVTAEEQLAWMDAALPGAFAPAVGGPVYRRLFADPIESLENLLLEQPEKLALVRAYETAWAEMPGKELQQALCGYYIDGRRTAAELGARVAAETGNAECPLVPAYLALLEQCGLVERAAD